MTETTNGRTGEYEPGTRFVLNDRCPWPERIGSRGVVVAPPADGTYPQPAAGEVVVLLDDDPLRCDSDHPHHFCNHDHSGVWTCVMPVDALDHELVIDAADGLFFADCRTCGWTGQRWETGIGAERDGEFHIEHPDLSGEHPVVPEEDTK